MIYLPIRPVAKGRPRFSGRGGFVRTYTPKKTKEFEDKIRCMTEKILKPVECFVGMEIEFGFKPTKSTSQKRAKELLNTPYDLKNVDLDNLIKSFLDGLNGVAYVDDSQVVEIKAKKEYTTDDYIRFRIYEVK